MNDKEINDFDLLIESHLGLERQGPGSAEMTLKALSFVENLVGNSEGTGKTKVADNAKDADNARAVAHAKVADIGCGTGGQTMVLAQNIKGHIVGVDMVPDFIDIFNDNAQKLQLSDRVQGVVADAFDLPFEKEELDLIWSEGMIDSLGFEKTLGYWNSFLKNDAYVVVTSPSWLTNERVQEIDVFWTDAGSRLYSVESNIESMQKTGYAFVAAFTLPEQCWMQNYFMPRMAAENALSQKYPGSKKVDDYIKSMKHEVDLYVKHKEHYGYVFYIGKKVSSVSSQA